MSMKSAAYHKHKPITAGFLLVMSLVLVKSSSGHERMVKVPC